MALKKIRLLPDQYLFKQGDEGNSAYLLISGTVSVIINDKSVGGVSEGEIFGELSLILGETRKASIKAVVPTELVEIKPAAFEELLLSSNLKLHKVIRSIAEELGKESGFTIPIPQKELEELVSDAPNVVRAMALQLHHRLSKMIYS